MNYEITQTDINKYVETTGIANLVPSYAFALLPQDIVDKYVAAANGYFCIERLTKEQRNSLSTEALNQFVANGGFLPDLRKNEAEKLTQDSINKNLESFDFFKYDSGFGVRQEIWMGYLSNLSFHQCDNIPPSTLAKYFLHGGLPYRDASGSVFDCITQDLINKCFENCADHTIIIKDVPQIEALPEEIINKYVLRGGNVAWGSGLTNKQIENIPQKIINQRASYGYSLSGFNPTQIENIPLKNIYEYISCGGSLNNLTPNQYESIPQNFKYQFVSKGNPLKNDDEMKNLPQKVINQYIANGGYIYDEEDKQIFTDNQINNIPQEIINLRVAKGPKKNGYYRRHQEFVNRVKERVPKELLEISDKTRNALILFGAGKIYSSELPLEVYVEPYARETLLTIIKNRLKQKFNTICEKNKYTNQVPDSVVASFNKKLNQIEEEIKNKMQEGLQIIEAKQKDKDVNAIKDISELRW